MKIKFETEKQKQDFEYYSEIKGKKLYKFFLNYFNTFDNNNSSSIEYKYILSLIKYDKRLKKVLYLYLGLFEEYIRTKLIDNSIYKNNLFVISNDINDLSSLYELSKKHYTIGKVIFLLKELELINFEAFKNYRSVNSLRNKVMHFDFLLLDFNKNKIFITVNNIEYLIEKLIDNLPKHYKDKCKNEINQVKKGLELYDEFKLKDFN